MSLFNRTVGSMSRDASRLEAERSTRTTVVEIDAVSPDQTTARVRVIAGNTRASESKDVRLILTPGLYCPINVANYIGLLHGDPKAPIGVQLIPRVTPRLDTRHGLSTGLFGNPGTQRDTEPVGRIQVPTDNIQQYINDKGHPDALSVVIKPPKPMEDAYGANQIALDSPETFIDHATAYMSVSEDEVRLVADYGNAMLINKQAGISIMGKVNIGTSIQDVRIGGAWRFNPMMQFQIPSTAVSPIPTLIYDIPGTNIMQGIQDQVDIINKIPGT